MAYTTIETAKAAAQISGEFVYEFKHGDECLYMLAKDHKQALEQIRLYKFKQKPRVDYSDLS